MWSSTIISGFHLTSLPPCWCTEQKRKTSFGNLTLLLCKTLAIIWDCFVHQHGHLITWLKTTYYFLPLGYVFIVSSISILKPPRYIIIYAYCAYLCMSFYNNNYHVYIHQNAICMICRLGVIHHCFVKSYVSHGRWLLVKMFFNKNWYWIQQGQNRSGIALILEILMVNVYSVQIFTQHKLLKG